LAGGFGFYAFTDGDPINYVDPFGENPLLSACAIGAAGSVLGGAMIAHVVDAEYGWREATADAAVGCVGLGALKRLRDLNRLRLFGQFALSKPRAANPALQRVIDKLFQASDKYAGGTAGVLRQEARTGRALSRGGHEQAARDRIRWIENVIDSNDLDPADYRLAQELIRDLKDAIGEFTRRGGIR
jgi:hypothetical protein